MDQVEFYYAMKNIENIIGYILIFVIFVLPFLYIGILMIYYKIKEKIEEWRNNHEKK